MNATAQDQSEPLCPLCVDLDGTLIKSDSLLDALCQFVRRRPLEIWRLPSWLAGGRAQLKQELAERAPLDAARLPYNVAVRTYLQAQRRQGRAIYLATGADAALAERVAAHLDLFDGVLASNGTTNLTSSSKFSVLKERFGEFDYIGNAVADLPLLAGARAAMVANPTPSLRLALRWRRTPIAQVFMDQRPIVRTVVKAVRVHQWAKNILLFAPLALCTRPASARRGGGGGVFLLQLHRFGQLPGQRHARHRQRPPASLQAAAAVCRRRPAGCGRTGPGPGAGRGCGGSAAHVQCGFCPVDGRSTLRSPWPIRSI